MRSRRMKTRGVKTFRTSIPWDGWSIAWPFNPTVNMESGCVRKTPSSESTTPFSCTQVSARSTPGRPAAKSTPTFARSWAISPSSLMAWSRTKGPLWYRGLAQLPDDDPDMAALLPRVLKTQEAGHIVIGHTPQLAVMPRFGGQVIAIDVGLSKPFNGPPAFLLTEDGKYFAVHRGRRLELPLAGGNVLEYLRSAAAALEPSDTRLRRSIQNRRP
jgi:hypothetical protein